MEYQGITPLPSLRTINRILNHHSLTHRRTGRYHIIRFIRRDLKLDIFGEIFPVPPELMYEYIIATVNVKEQKLKLFLDKIQVE